MRDPTQVDGWVAEEVSDEFPEVGLVTVECALARRRRSPRELRMRLDGLANRFTGANALHLRRSPIPAAYRIFFHHIGLDPDQTRTPIEQAVLERMVRGGFRSEGLIHDALLVALVETGVPVWALDADRVWGPLGLRLAHEGEALGRHGDPRDEGMTEGRMVVADLQSPLAVLFGDIAEGHGLRHESRHTVLFTVQVGGVPRIHVEEALWQCADLLGRH
jgi:DNA/RNA-binding domain of Phe-tRNA-synthetase-like protein